MVRIEEYEDITTRRRCAGITGSSYIIYALCQRTRAVVLAMLSVLSVLLLSNDDYFAWKLRKRSRTVSSVAPR